MNANELANELDDCGKFFEDGLYKEAATMLRQQQAEIEALKAHPVKELTDEEILEICDLGEWHRDEFAINFARAILLKAQEK